MGPKYSTAATIMYGLLKVIFLRLKSSLCLLEGPYNPTTASPMKTSLKIDFESLETFSPLYEATQPYLKVGKLGWNRREGTAFEL